MNIKDFYQLIERIKKSESEHCLKGLCQEFCEMSGMEYFILTTIENKSLYSSTLKSESNLEKELIKKILSDREKTNNFLSSQMNRNIPQSWSKKKHKKTRTNNIMELIEILSKNGLNSGINIPLKTHD
ncbi:hypothetical protein L1D50_22885, partial [Pseudoalteromonas sp. Isolate6]